MAMPFSGEKGEKAREFETPMKGRERLAGLANFEGRKIALLKVMRKRALVF